MPHRPDRSRVMLALASASVLLLAGASRQAVAQAQPPLPEVFGGTVRSVELATGTLELLTGVGHAMRVMRMSTLPATRALSAGAAIRLSDLKPGDVLRIECHLTERGLMADRIERMAGPEMAP